MPKSFGDLLGFLLSFDGFASDIRSHVSGAVGLRQGAVRMRVAGFLSPQSRDTRRAPYLQRSPRFSCSRTQVENPGDLSLSCITHAELRTGSRTALQMPEIQPGLL